MSASGPGNSSSPGAPGMPDPGMMNRGMIDLGETADGSVQYRLPPGRDLPGWHRAVVAEIAAHLGAAHAAVFAVPVRGERGWRWQAPGRSAREIATFEAGDRRALTAALSAILSDVRRLAESGLAPAVRAAWPALGEVPDWNNVLAVDGRPVLTAWGHLGADGRPGPLAALDDGRLWIAPPGTPWRVFGWTLAALAAFALLAGIVLALLWPRLFGASACVLAPGQADLLAEQNRAIDEGTQLRNLRAALDDQLARRRLMCPLPHAAPPAPSPRADLPQDSWEHHDLAMLDGCWHSTTQMVLKDEATGRRKRVAEWLLCFNRQGRGTQTVRIDDGEVFKGPQRASFSDDGQLTLADTDRAVSAQGRLRRGRFECRRVSDKEAVCERTDVEGPAAGARQSGRFSR